jgi:hypothetical protein
MVCKEQDKNDSGESAQSRYRMGHRFAGIWFQMREGLPDNATYKTSTYSATRRYVGISYVAFCWNFEPMTSVNGAMDA